ncbi:MAG: four-carbon acid sugar kinase family protein [Erysipelotrichaceae bacterium]|nr:four-carbon acid sugar kinase family protein [Erysipelotrichaceae bacterium]
MNKDNVKLLILADDLTGALDSGVQFASKGDKVIIRSDYRKAFDGKDNTDVLVIDTESRHISSTEAYNRIYALAKEAYESGIKKIYKKTDSGLRGNVGAELKAVIDATKTERLEFVPAWPKMNRTTANGIHYVNGQPLSESIFAKDVIDPVSESHIDRLIQKQADVEVTLHESGKPEKGIVVYDCTSDQQLEDISAELLSRNEETFIAAGCAGFLEKLPKQSNGKKCRRNGIVLPEKLMVLSGSMNEVTARQLAIAEGNGSYRIHAPMDRIAADDWSEDEIREFCREFLDKADTPVAIIDTMEEIKYEGCRDLSQQIASYMGRISKGLLEEGMNRTLMIVGGDTLKGFISVLGITSLQPVEEVAPGIVIAKYKYKNKVHYLIAKSGAFGTDNQLQEIQHGL